VVRVERHVCHAGPPYAEQRDHQVGAPAQADRHRGTGPAAARVQKRRELVGPGVQLRVVQLPEPFDHRDGSGRGGRLTGDEIRQ
jgi:hypothetical protein